jgi:hypothetical protein
MTTDGTATIIAGLLGGLLGLAGVWIGFHLSRRASEHDRQAEALYKIYLNIEILRTLLRAFQKQMIDKAQLHRKWNGTTEEFSLH